MKSDTKVIKIKGNFGDQRTARYRLTAEAAKLMYNSRSGSDKGTPFDVYIAKCVMDSGILWPVSEIELY